MTADEIIEKQAEIIKLQADTIVKLERQLAQLTALDNEEASINGLSGIK